MMGNRQGFLFKRALWRQEIAIGQNDSLMFLFRKLEGDWCLLDKEGVCLLRIRKFYPDGKPGPWYKYLPISYRTDWQVLDAENNQRLTLKADSHGFFFKLPNQPEDQIRSNEEGFNRHGTEGLKLASHFYRNETVVTMTSRFHLWEGLVIAFAFLELQPTFD